MIPVTKPHVPAKKNFDRYIRRAFKTKILTNSGPLVQELTSRLESYLGVRNLLLVGNGTLGIQIALKLLGMAGEVATTPFSFPATTSSLVWEGCRPVFWDINPDDFNIVVPEQRECLPKLKGLLATHVFGCPVDERRLSVFRKTYGLPVIFDAAHAFGVTLKGESILNLGDISVLSFHATKIFHTIEGGALIISDDDLYERAKKIINFGISSEGQVEEVGINAKMNEFEAAMGLAVLDEIEQILTVYRGISLHYDDCLDPILKRQSIPRQCGYNYSYFPVCFPDETSLLQAFKKLSEKNIFPRRYFSPSLNNVAVYGGSIECPVSEDISNRIACLPIYSDLDLSLVKIISDVINDSISKRS